MLQMQITMLGDPFKLNKQRQRKSPDQQESVLASDQAEGSCHGTL